MPVASGAPVRGAPDVSPGGEGEMLVGCLLTERVERLTIQGCLEFWQEYNELFDNRFEIEDVRGGLIDPRSVRGCGESSDPNIF